MVLVLTDMYTKVAAFTIEMLPKMFMLVSD